MKFGIMPYSQVSESTSTTFAYVKSVAILAEKNGFESLWLGFHHSAAEPYLHSLITLAGLSQVTSRISLGTSIIFPAFHHPLHLAEATATLDALSDGRLILGVAIGYVDAEFNMFNVRKSERVPRMMESLTLLRKLWTQKSVTYVGKFHNLSGASTVPSTRTPHPPIWIGATTKEAIRRAARIGDGWLISTRRPNSTIQADIATYKAAAKDFGRDLENLDIALIRYVSIAKTDDEAMKFAGPRMNKVWEEYTDLGADLFRSDDPDMLKGRMIVGSPDSCIQQIEHYQKIGVRHLVLQFSIKAPEIEVEEKAIPLFRKKILPYFHNKYNH